MFYFKMIWLVGAIRVIRRWCPFSLWANEQHCEGWGLTTWNPAMTRLFWLEVRPCFVFFVAFKTRDHQSVPGVYRYNIYIYIYRVIWRYCWWFRNPVNSPVEVGNLSYFYRVFFNIPDGCLGFLASTVSSVGLFSSTSFGSPCNKTLEQIYDRHTPHPWGTSGGSIKASRWDDRRLSKRKTTGKEWKS